jgi:hypothetical protein
MNPEIYAAEAYNNYQHHQKKNNQPPLPSIFNIGCGPPDEQAVKSSTHKCMTAWETKIGNSIYQWIIRPGTTK